MKHRFWFPTLSLALLSSLFAMIAVCAAPAAQGAVTRSISFFGTSSPQTGDFTPSGSGDVTQAEFPAQEDEEDGGPGPYPGTSSTAALSQGTGKRRLGKQRQEGQVESAVQRWASKA